MLDSAGNLLANHYHDPFGKAWNVKGDIGNDIRFTGKEYEEDIGLFYFAARWYDPDIGRFISPDPFDTINYIYAANNPFRYIDPTGLWFWDAVGSFFAGLGKALGNIFGGDGGADSNLGGSGGAGGTVSSGEAYQKGKGELADKAFLFANDKYGERGGYNDEKDAFRHAVWSALMTKELGEGNAEAIGSGHELQEMNYNMKNPKEAKMDLYNNAIGRKLATDPNCPTDSRRIADFIYQNRNMLQKGIR